MKDVVRPGSAKLDTKTPSEEPPLTHGVPVLHKLVRQKQ